MSAARSSCLPKMAIAHPPKCSRAYVCGFPPPLFCLPSSLTYDDDRPLSVKRPCWPLTIRSLRCAKVITLRRAICEPARCNVVACARARDNLFNNDAFSNNERLRNLMVRYHLAPRSNAIAKSFAITRTITTKGR